MLWGGAIAQQKQAAGGDEAALKAVEEKWDAANLKGDAAALGAIFADTFISTSSEGKVRTRAEMLAQLKSGEIKYQTSKVDDMKVFVYGDAAVVNGRWKAKFVEKGKTVDATERFTDTYIRQNGQWRCVASQGSTIK
jgi:ketosteroid isomerase-like protein